MSDRYDAIVIGAGLGGLTAAAVLAKAGRKVLLVERNHGVGGAASTYKYGDLVVEASLHETSDPLHPADPKHHILTRLGVLNELQWVATGGLYEVRGGPVGAPLAIPDGFDPARDALCERFPSAAGGLRSVLGEMQRIASGLGVLSRGREAFAKPAEGFAALAKLAPVVSTWRRSVSERFGEAFGANEAVKCALAANLPYWHDDPDGLWWVLFAVAQGGYLGCGARYVRGGSQRLSHALARVVTSAGGTLALRRAATAVLLDARGNVRGVAHKDHPRDRDHSETLAPIVICNAAPANVAEMLNADAQGRFWAPYANRPLSISLFSLTFGLASRPAEFGLRSYSTFLLPGWMQTLRDHRSSAALLAGPPGERMPVMAIVNYSVVDSGLGGPPYPVSVVGVDRIANWEGLDAATYEAKRAAWRDAIAAAIDEQFRGFKDSIVASVFSTASTMRSYLNVPDGAIYGFAPLPPKGAIWHGSERSVRTAIPGLYLGSAYGGSGGFTGAILAGAAAADMALARTPSRR